jgi:uncharacterized protein with von Willebrand factor type A (vWA) domain
LLCLATCYITVGPTADSASLERQARPLFREDRHSKHPETEIFEEMMRHVRQTIWITPEPKWGWSLGSCDMPLYEPLCDRVEVVRTVEQLAGVAEEFVRSRA